MWLPIEALTDDDVKAMPTSLAAAVEEARAAQVAGPLTRGDMEYSLLDIGLSGSVSAGLFKAEAKYQRVLTTSSLVIFEETTVSGKVVRVGGSVRLIVGVTVKSGEFSLSLPSVAAAMTLGQAEAFFKVHWSGLDITKVGESLSKINAGPEPLSVQNYQSLVQALDEVKKAILTTQGSVIPRPVSLLIDDNEYRTAVGAASAAQTYAVSCVADGRSQRDALQDLDQTVAWAGQVSTLYDSVSGTSDPSARPDEARQTAARMLLRRYRLTR